MADPASTAIPPKVGASCPVMDAHNEGNCKGDILNMLKSAPAKKPRSKVAVDTQMPGLALKVLRQYIKDKKLEPGMRLPAERELADMFSVAGSPCARPFRRSLFWRFWSAGGDQALMFAP